MKPAKVLDVLESAGLVRAAASTPEPVFKFRHGLLQDTAYHSLLRREREKLHQQVGAAIERCYPERTDELAALLGNHFLLGGNRQQALHYLRRAGEMARGRYANAEALEYFSSALKVARDLQQPRDQAALHRERGRTYEIVGDFHAARKDFEAALSIGEDLDEDEIEWTARLDLGKLWAAKDYARTGEYFRQALELARSIGDAKTIARSLNRLGNWYINRGEADEGKQLHEEAIQIFERADDRRGVAATLDLLGMSHMISGDIQRGNAYYERAIEHLRALGDKHLLASALTARALRAGDALSETAIGISVELVEPMEELQEAKDISRELGWKSGESYALWMESFVNSARGDLDRGVAAAEQAIRLAQEMGHRQWLAAAHCALSRARLERFELDQARSSGERARQLALETRSYYWIGNSRAALMLACIEQGAFERVEALWNEVSGSGPGMEMLGDRLVWMARIESLLAQQEYQQALPLVDGLIQSAPGFTDEAVIPRLFLDWAICQMERGRIGRARARLEAGMEKAQQVGLRSLEWRMHAGAARLEEREGNSQAAASERQRALAILEDISQSISDQEQCEAFLRQARQRVEAWPVITPQDQAT